MEEFLIVRLSSLGDIIHTLPAFSALRKARPQSRISWLVEEKGQEILELVPGIDRIFPVSLKRWAPGSARFWKEVLRLRKAIQKKNRTAIDFQGLVKSGFYAFLSGAETRVGFHRKNLKEPLASIFYTDATEPLPEDIHVIEKNLKLLSKLAIEAAVYDFPLEIPERIAESVRMILEGAGYNRQKKLLLLNVGAAWETKRWPAGRWSRLIALLRNKEVFPLLLWGKELEKTIARDVVRETGTPMVPPLSLQEVMALVREAALVVSGDTFVLQAACALSRPVVGLFGPTDPRRNGPFRAEDTWAFHRLECSGCYKRACSRIECLDLITPKEVAALCLEVLKKHG
ncbi:MAG: lipopolysaccharide heptosyltransferase I [Candidatus Aminicenantales bacterium]